MKELRDKQVISGLLSEIARKSAGLSQPIKIMEVCGTHTMTLHKYGLKSLLKNIGVDMLSGPGCPVCITPNSYHEAAINLVTRRSGLILTTFGDMTRVPTHVGSLQTAVPAAESEIKIVYSPTEAIDLARRSPDKEVVFFGVGFETTIPSISVIVREAFDNQIKNMSVLSALWIIPPPLEALAASPNLKVQGFLYPGHVSAIIGLEPYRFMAEKYGLPGTVAGFEPGDMLLGISALLDQIRDGRADVTNAYARVVRPEGNPQARRLMDEVLEKKDALWRGLGWIPQSGLRIRDRFQTFDAEVKYKIDRRDEADDLPGCRCGEVLQGILDPPGCSLFAKKCSPDSPQGPCMVSFEGACLAQFKYGRLNTAGAGRNRT